MHLEVAESYAYGVHLDGWSSLYVCENEPLEKLLFNRDQPELEFVNNCRRSTRLFLRHIQDEIRECGSIAELMVLSKGYYYFVHNAFEVECEQNLPINFVATNRTSVSDTGVSVSIHYENLDAACENLIIGDTVASGETICTVLQSYLAKHPLKKVFIISFAGTMIGAKRISAYCRDENIECTFLFGLAVFGLASNGFDISFFSNETQTAAKYREKAHYAFGDLGISVAGWDFGSQAQAPRKYHALARIEANYWGLPDSPIFPAADGAIDLDLVRKEWAAFGSQIRDPSVLE